MFRYTRLLKMLAFVAPAVVAVQPANYAIFSASNNISGNDSKVNTATADIEINYSDNGILDNINSFDDYSSIYTDAKTPVLTTDVGTLGMNNDKNTIILTAYNGLVVWANNLVNNDAVKKFYSTLNTPINDISSYTVKSWQKVDNSNNAIILFSDATNSNVSVFLIDLRNGQLVKNTNGDLVATTVSNNGSIIYQTADDKSFFVINTTYGPAKDKLNNIDKVTISADFSSITNNVLTDKANANSDRAKQLVRYPNDDIFYGYAPGAIGGGVNYAFFYSKGSSEFSAFKNKVYVAAIDNNFNKMDEFYGYEQTTNAGDGSDKGYDGWQTTGGDAQAFTEDDTEWQNINKQFLYMGDRNNYSWTNGNNQADWIVMNTASKNDYAGNWGANGKPVNGEKYAIKLMVVRRGTMDKNYNRYVYSSTVAYTNQLTSLSVGSNSIYYTSKANESNYNYQGHPTNPDNRNAIDKEIVGMVYVDYVSHSWGNANNSLVYVVKKRRYTVDKYEGNDYNAADPTYKQSTIAPINGYSNKTNLGYQLITPNTTDVTKAQVGTYSSDNIPNVSDTAVNDYQATSYSSTYHKIEDVQSALTNGFGKNKLPSDITANVIKPYLKFKYEGQTDATTPGTGYTVTPTVSNQDDNNGSLDYSYQVDFTTDWNKRTDKTYVNSFTISNTLDNLYKLSDFSFQFVTSDTVDSTKWAEVQKLMTSGTAIKVTKANVLSNFIKYTIKDKNDNAFTITEDMVSLAYANGNTELTVTITLPAASFPDSFGTDKLTQTHTFTGFQRSPTATVEWNTNDKNNVTVANNTATVDLTVSDLGTITKSINATTLVNEINTTYKDSFMSLFTVSGYDYTITNTASNQQNGTANFKIVFDIKYDYVANQNKVEYNVNFTGLIKPASMSVQQQYSNVSVSGQNITLNVSTMAFGIVADTQINNKLRVEKFIEGLQTKYKGTLDLFFAKTGYTLKTVTDTTTEENQYKGIATLTMTYTVMSGYEGNDITWNVTVSGLSPKLPTATITPNPNNKNNVTVNNNDITVNLINESLTANINKNLRIETFLTNLNTTYKDELANALFSATGYTNGDFDYSTTTDAQQRQGIAKLSVIFTKNTGYDGDTSITYNITINGLAKKQDSASIGFDTTTSRPYVEFDTTNKTATISLSKGSLGNINNSLTTASFTSGINSVYKDSILSLFTTPIGYSPTLSYSQSDVDKLNGTVIVKVVFEKEINYDGDQTVEYTLTFTDFKPIIDAYVNVNNDVITNSNNAIIYTDTTKTFDVNLSNYSLGNINNKIYSDNFVNNISDYSNDILRLFEIKDYRATFGQTTSDNNQGTASVSITFTNNIDSSQLIYTINFSGFALVPYVHFNMNMINKYDNVTTNSITSTNMDLTIDLSKNKFNSITSDLLPNEIANDFNAYQNDILSLFSYDVNDYTPTFTTLYDENNNAVDVEVVFTLNNQLIRNASKAVDKPTKITAKVAIVGFDKELVTSLLITIITISLIAVLALIIIITTWTIINKRKATKIDKPNKNNKFIKK